jgi:hypothetical protein
MRQEFGVFCGKLEGSFYKALFFYTDTVEAFAVEGAEMSGEIFQ